MKNRLWLYLFAILFQSVGMAGFHVVSSFLLKNILQAAQTGDTTGLGRQIFYNIIVGIILLLVWRYCTICYNVEAKRAIARLEEKVFAKSTSLPMEYYESHHSGDFMSKLIYDTNKAGDIFGSRFRRLVTPILSVAVFVIPMFFLCWQVTLCLIAGNILMLAINTFYVKPMKNSGKDLSSSNARMTERLTNLIAGVELTKLFSNEDMLVNKYKEANKEYLNSKYKMNYLSAGLSCLMEGLKLVNALLFLAVGIYFVGNGVTTVGNLAAIYTMSGICGWQFLQIGRYMPELASCLVNAERVFAFIDKDEEPVSYSNPLPLAKDAKEVEGYVSFAHVDFSYEESRSVLKDFSLQVPKGATVALTGESGSGKSTIAKLLLGFYGIDGGAIWIDGKPMDEYKLADVREMIAYVPQEPYLYEVSIAENISYGKPGASQAEIEAAAKAANAHDFISRLESGYETLPGERGSRLSGGERQRIAIARAFLKNAPILLLDEATSALDNESERLVSEAVEKLMDGRTTIMIAHRPSTIARANMVIKLS